MDNNDQNNLEENSQSVEDLNDLNMDEYGEGDAAPNEYLDMGYMGEVNFNDINELNVDINEDDNNMNNHLDEEEQEPEEQINNPDFENEDNLNEEEQDIEQDEINVSNNNNINEMNLNNDKGMNYMMNNNLNQNDINNENEIDDNIDTNLQGNFNVNNNGINDNENDNNTNMDNMVNMQPNEAMINNDDMNNMNELNNEENYNNNELETSDNQNNLNNDANYINMDNLNNMNNNPDINDYNDINEENLKNEMNEINNNDINVNSDDYDPNINLNQGFEAGYDQEEEENFMEQNMNDNMILNNNNNINNNYYYKNQQLIGHIKDINERFGELEKEFKSLEKQNKQLQIQLNNEKMKNRDIKPNDILIYENTINKGKMFIEEEKKKNAVLKNTISQLEEEKKSLEYQLIEAKQRIKRLESDSNINNQEEKKSENNNNNGKDESNEIINLKNKIDQFEIANSKLKLDNENLKKSMENKEKEYIKQKNLITNYKNSELSTFHKVIMQYKEYFKNHNINPDINIANANDRTSNNKNKSNENNFDYGKIMIEMTNKDKIIKSLSVKLDKYMSEYKSILEEKQISQQKFNQLVLYNKKTIDEKKDLIKKIQNLKMEMSNIKQKLEMNITQSKNSKYIYENNAMKMQEKLAEYKQKVITLKLKINEMLGYNPKAKLSNQNSKINLNNKQKFNNYVDINQMSMTPSQKKKILGTNTGNLRLNKAYQTGAQFDDNIFYNKKNNNNDF